MLGLVGGEAARSRSALQVPGTMRASTPAAPHAHCGVLAWSAQ
jgi:hypothetical protein